MMFGHVLAGERDKSLKRIQKGRVKFLKKNGEICFHLVIHEQYSSLPGYPLHG